MSRPAAPSHAPRFVAQLHHVARAIGRYAIRLAARMATVTARVGRWIADRSPIHVIALFALFALVGITVVANALVR